MLDLYDQLVRRCAARECVALCTLVAARGSTPQGAGAKMLVLETGSTLGTLGGGCVEAEVRRRALELMAAGRSDTLTFKLDHDYGWDDGLICGGTIQVHVAVLSTPEAAAPFAEAAEALRAGRPAALRFPYAAPDGPREYVEEVAPAPTLLIVGGGHVGQALARLAHELDFWVHVLDDRVDFASPDRFPHARRHIVGDVETELARYPVTEHTYVVIVTRGHRHDGRALAAVVRSPARYVGLIGSRRKVHVIFEDLKAAGVPAEALARVHAPIGLDIGAVTVPEIALSIAAELVAVRRGREGEPALPLMGTLARRG
jgi:xanthine dehydrogenase accessory factor